MLVHNINPTPQREPSKVVVAPVDFDALCRADASARGWDPTAPGAVSPYLQSAVMAKLIADFHARVAGENGVNPHKVVTWGGYFEDRGFMWKGSYMDEESKYLHLGIDVNVPAGTKVRIPEDMIMIRTDDDKDSEGGWGPRVILYPCEQVKDFDFVVIYAHLQNVATLPLQSVVRKGTVIGEIGDAPHNGNWWPHLHVQLVAKAHFDRLVHENRLPDLDGYCMLPRSQDEGTRTKEVDQLARYMRISPHPGRYLPQEWDL